MSHDDYSIRHHLWQIWREEFEQTRQRYRQTEQFEDRLRLSTALRALRRLREGLLPEEEVG